MEQGPQDPQQLNPLLWISLIQMASELVPSVAVLALTHRNQDRKRNQFKYYESLIESESDEEYGNFNENLNKVPADKKII